MDRNLRATQALWIVFWANLALMSLRAERKKVAPLPLLDWVWQLGFFATAFGLLNAPVGPRNPKLLRGPSWSVLGLSIQTLGLVFSGWAHLRLGRNWGVSPDIKIRHRLVQDGPYRWFRHPMYTGMLLQMLGSSLSRGNLQALLSTPILYVGCRLRAHTEEELLEERFGEAYTRYKLRTPPMLPFPLWE